MPVAAPSGGYSRTGADRAPVTECHPALARFRANRRIYASLCGRTPLPHGVQISPFGAALSVAAWSCAVPYAAGSGAGSLAIANAPAVTGGAQRGHGCGHSAVPIDDPSPGHCTSGAQGGRGWLSGGLLTCERQVGVAWGARVSSVAAVRSAVAPAIARAGEVTARTCDWRERVLDRMREASSFGAAGGIRGRTTRSGLRQGGEAGVGQRRPAAGSSRPSACGSSLRRHRTVLRPRVRSARARPGGAPAFVTNASSAVIRPGRVVQAA